jgi:hypothetical protein
MTPEEAVEARLASVESASVTGKRLVLAFLVLIRELTYHKVRPNGRSLP